MELRVLEYFLAVAREQSITRAAEFLHITQPTLSRQLTELEQELGQQLLVRGKRKVTLTEAGCFFRKRADEIVSLAERTQAEMKYTGTTIAGDIYIGTGESGSIRNILRVARQLQLAYPHLHFHLTSGDSDDLVDRLDKGLFDFCILYGDIDQSKYEYLTLPYRETWGLLLRRDDPLSSKPEITPQDLWDKPLILSRHSLSFSGFFKWLGKKPEELNITATYNLVYNSTFMAEEGMGYVLTLENLVNTQGTPLCFRRIEPVAEVQLSLVWKKYQTQSRAASAFISALEESIGSNPQA